MFVNSKIAISSAVYDISNMAEPTGNRRVYDALMALKPDHLTPNAWAMKAGLGRSIFDGIRAHNNPTSETLQKLLDAINVSYVDFMAAQSPVKTEVRGAGPVGFGDVRREFHGEEPLPKLPLYGSAVGGEYDDVEEHIELTELHLGEVLDYLNRPLVLAKDPDAYALTIVGDSMVPRFKPSERVAVSPRSTIGIGDDVIVQLRGEDDRIVMVLVKELVRRTSSHIELKQYNPEVTFRIPIGRVGAMHKVRGHYLF